MSTNEPEKTLFGTIFDSNKLLTKVDYTDFYNGKWNKNKDLKEALKHGKFISITSFSFYFLFFRLDKLK